MFENHLMNVLGFGILAVTKIDMATECWQRLERGEKGQNRGDRLL